MRRELTASFEKMASLQEFCLLTGDLGFMTFESLQQKMGHRFINAGIAEQNMLSMAAGLARQGFRPWVYSIAPFCYARPFEQIRNDIALHDLPVRIVGNGAGYGYGVQGPTHHALEDCGVMRSLQNMEVYAPAFRTDIPELADMLTKSQHPAYIRIGYDFLPEGVKTPAFANFRVLLSGAGGTVFALGSMGGHVYSAVAGLSEKVRPALCVCCTFPENLEELPSEVQENLHRRLPVYVVEEHVQTGGLAECLALLFCKNGITPEKFCARNAAGYPSHRYGSQQYYWKKSGLDIESLSQMIKGI